MIKLKDLLSEKKSINEQLFPDVVKVKKSKKITQNTNNPSDRLPAGIYKSTGREFDGMHIYTSKGKKWFLYPEDMDIINEETIKGNGLGKSINEQLFPDVVKVKKSKKITQNTNNPSDRLPAGIYKSTGREFDGMHIYTSKGKKWFLYPEDMDIINEETIKGNGLGKSVINEANYKVYHKSFTDAADEARNMAEKRGFEINEDDWQTQVALGGKNLRSRPSEGKTTSFTVGLSKDGKPQRKALNFQVYGMKNGYELNAYIN